MTPTNPPVLVVGGGPVGTTVAIELLRRGVPCRVVDRAAGPAVTSRAFTLHARTLEVFAMQGLAERFLERGIVSRGLDFRFLELGRVFSLDFRELDSPYPFILVINQNVVEDVLRTRMAELGGILEWETELTGLAFEADERIRVTVTNRKSGRAETLEPRFLVGCDGIHSFVRRNLGIAFEGDSYSGQEMRMMDVPLSHWPLGDDAIHYLITKNRMLLVTKLPGRNYRLLVSDMGDSHRSETARGDFQLLMDAVHPDVRLGEPEWATVFEIWKRVSARYRRAGAFLCGDAAHIHSPAGGQGMNACLHDAFNLGWKLALVTRGEASPALLDGYERERRPIAEQVIAGSHLMHQVMMAHGTALEERIAITASPEYHTKTVRQVSGLAYTYRAADDACAGGLVDGDRAPDAPLGGGRRVHDLLRFPGLTLLAFVRGEGSTLGAYAHELAGRFGDRVQLCRVPSPGSSATTSDDVAPAESEAAHAVYGATEGDVLALVRPDGYLAAIRPGNRRDEIASSLATLLDDPVRGRLAAP